MFVSLLISFLIVGIAIDILSVHMKMRVNADLPVDRRLSWWSRSYRQVNRLYSEQHPDSILPDLNRFGGYVALALFGATLIVSLLARD